MFFGLRLSKLSDIYRYYLFSYTNCFIDISIIFLLRFVFSRFFQDKSLLLFFNFSDTSYRKSMRFIFSLDSVQLRTLSCTFFIVSLFDYNIIDFLINSRFTLFSILYFSQKTEISETISAFRLERLFFILSFAMRRSINTILSKEFASILSKQRVAIQ